MTFYDDASGPRRPPRRGRVRSDAPASHDEWDDTDEELFEEPHQRGSAQPHDSGVIDGDGRGVVQEYDNHTEHLEQMVDDDDDEYDGYEYDGYEDEYDDDDYVDLRRERVPRVLVAIGVVVLIVVAAVGGGAWWYHRQVEPPGGPGEAVTVEVPQGASSSRIGELLADADVVSNSTLFNFFVSRKSAGPWLAGNYRLQKNSSFDEAIAGLDKGPKKASVQQQITTKVTIPEGFTVAKILARISEKVPRLKVEDLQAALDSGEVPSKFKPADVTSYEGLLFPATYEVGDTTTAAELLTEMAATMEQRVDQLGPAQAQADIKARYGVDVTPYDLLKVASMIQYEAAGEADAAKIGTVTYNRLGNGTPLGYDSTSIYEAEQAGKDINKVNYKAVTPYNTRTNAGLPPTPIAAPGLYALEGALKPAEGPWLYFVLTDSKEVTFTVTYDDFLKAKALCKQRGLGCG